MLPTVTLKEVLSWGPCWPKARVRKVWKERIGRRKPNTLEMLDILAKPEPDYIPYTWARDVQLWVVCHMLPFQVADAAAKDLGFDCKGSGYRFWFYSGYNRYIRYTIAVLREHLNGCS